ncbi:hypothetical protein PAERUG_P47_London_12_VIM_2_12_12_01943 [Pseudomonas aeruginosa]|nr:hypothetical protein PAERUG_P47_London_12_VIM_2_12_12_01943 [Pseudomonas aeruginosa]
MADAAGEGADALSAETTQLLGGQLAFVRHADPQAGQCDVPYLAQVAGAAEGAEPGLGFGGVDGGLHRHHLFGCVRTAQRRYGFARLCIEGQGAADLVGDAVGLWADHHLQAAGLARTYHGHRTEGLELGVRGLVAVDQAQTQARGAGVHHFEVGCATQGADECRGALGFGVVARFAARVVFPARGLQVEAADAEVEHQVIDAGIEQAQRPEHPAVGGTAPAQGEVDGATGEGEAEADVEQVGEGHGQAGEQRMQQVEQRREEHEGELHRLGDAGEEGGQGHRQEQPADQLAPLRTGVAVHRQAGGGQAEHHHREHPGHELAALRVAGEIARQVAGDDAPGFRVGEATEDEPHQVVEDVVQPGDDQQAVQHAEGEGAEAAAFQHELAEAVDALLQRWPDHPEQQAQADRADPGGDRHEAAAAEERQVFRQLHVLEAVIQGASHQAADDAGEHAHVDARIDHLEHRDHHQVADGAGEAGGAIVVASETDGDADGEDQRQVGEDRLAGVVDQRNVEQVDVAQAQQQAGDRQDRDRQHQGAAQALQAFDQERGHGGGLRLFLSGQRPVLQAGVAHRPGAAQVQ